MLLQWQTASPSLPHSIWCRQIDMVDHQHRNRLLRRLKLKPKLLLNRRKQRRSRVVTSRCIVGSPFQLEIVAIRKVRLIDPDTPSDLRQLFRYAWYGQAFAIEMGAAGAYGLSIRFARLQLRAALSKDEVVGRQTSRLL